MNALNRDLFALVTRAAKDHSASLLCFFVGVASSLLYDVILVDRVSLSFIVIINVFMAGVIATSPSVRPFVSVCRQAASGVGNEALDILSRHATKAFLAATSKPLAFLIKTIMRLRKALKDEVPTVTPPVVPEDFSNYGTCVAGFVAGRLVHLIVQFVAFLVQTRVFLFLFSCFQSLLNIILSNLYLFHLMYFVCIALLSSIATTVFVIVY